MEQIQSKYIVIDHSNNTISLSKKPESLRFRPITDEVFENATIVFNDNNSITLEGDCWQYGLELHDIYPSELPYKVHPNYIEKTRFRKKDIVRAGWHRKADNVHTKIILNNFKIIQDENR